MAECLVFAVDLDAETCQEAVRGCTRLDCFKQSILTLAASKKRVDSKHMFSLAVLQSGARLVLSPSNSLEALAAALKELKPSDTNFDSFDLGSLGGVVQEAARCAANGAGAPRQDALQVRVVLFYCRSCTIPTCSATGRPINLDVMYMHERPAPGVNCPQEVFTALEEHCDAMAHAAGHHAYIFECNANNLKKWLSILVWLLCHPKQRRPQTQLPMVPTDLATVAPPANSTGSASSPPDRGSFSYKAAAAQAQAGAAGGNGPAGSSVKAGIKHSSSSSSLRPPGTQVPQQQQQYGPGSAPLSFAAQVAAGGVRSGSPVGPAPAGAGMQERYAASVGSDKFHQRAGRPSTAHLLHGHLAHRPAK